MSGSAYPHDITGSLASNLVKGERYTISEHKNKWLSIIPNYAPFFRKDLILVHVESGRTLYEGLDYYLGHNFREATKEARQQVFGSIMIIDGALDGTIEFQQYRTVGNPFNIPREEIDKYLSRVDTAHPRNADWEDVMKFPRPVPISDKIDDLPEAIARDVVVGSASELADELTKLNNLKKSEFDQIVDDLVALNNKIVDQRIQYHELLRNQHGLTHTQLNAMHKDGTVVDSLKAYGYSVTELVNYIYSNGVRRSILDELYKLSGGEFNGAISFENDHLVIENNDGAAFINVVNNNMTIAGTTDIAILSDTGNANEGSGVQLMADQNILAVHSDGSDVEQRNPTYNGVYLVDVGNLGDYIPEPTPSDTNIFVSSTEDFILGGSGVTISPLYGEVVLPVAVDDGVGIFSLNDSINSNSTIEASTSSAIFKLAELIASRVDDSITVNQKALTGNITLDVDDFNLGNVDNTNPQDKEPSNQFKALVSGLLSSDHTHNFSDVTNIVYATSAIKGLTKLGTSVNDSEDLAITPAAAVTVVDKLNTVGEKIKTLVPGKPFGLTQYGGFNYLPLPIFGEYGSAGKGSNYLAAVIEANGDLVVLRNGGDSVSSGVYYWYSALNDNGGFAGIKPTTVEYRPAFINDDDRVAEVFRGGSECFLLRTVNGKYYLVITGNTMDASQHVGYEIDVTSLSSVLAVPTIYNGDVYFINFNLAKGTHAVSVNVKKVVLEPNSSGLLVATNVKLSGIAANGDARTNVDVLDFYDMVHSDDPADNALFLDNDDGHWTGRNYNRMPLSYAAARDGKNVNIRCPGITYLSNSYSSKHSGIYVVSVSVDLETGNCIFANSYDFPISVESTGVKFKPGNNFKIPWSGTSSLDTTVPIECRDKLVTLSTYTNITTPRLYVDVPNGDKSVFEHLGDVTSGFNHVGNVLYTGLYGSVLEGGVRSLGFIDGNRMISRDRAGRCVASEYDVNGSYTGDGKGWGPTINREIIDPNLFYAMLSIPRLWDKNKNAGWSFSKTRLAGTSVIINDAAYDILSLDISLHASIISDFRASLSDVDDSLIIDIDFTGTMFDQHTSPDREMFLTFILVLYRDSSRTTKEAWVYCYNVEHVFTDTELTSVTLGTEIIKHRFTTNAVALNNPNLISMASRIRNDDNSYHYFINFSNWCSYIGYGMVNGIALQKNEDGTYTDVHRYSLHTHRAYGRFTHPSLHRFEIDSDSTAESVVVKSSYGVEPSVILATNVASGLILHFTEETTFYNNGKPYLLSPISIDLTTYSGISAYQNATIYVSVNIDEDDVASYVLTDDPVVDDENNLSIGFIKTNSTVITDISIERATRLGEMATTDEHFDEFDAHGSSDVSTRDYFGLGNLVNQPLDHEITEQSDERYASAEMVRQLDLAIVDTVAFRHGQVAHGAKIPIPPGFSESECKAIVTLDSVSANPIINLEVKVDSGLNVTCLVNGQPGTAKYQLTATKNT